MKRFLTAGGLGLCLVIAALTALVLSPRIVGARAAGNHASASTRQVHQGSTATSSSTLLAQLNAQRASVATQRSHHGSMLGRTSRSYGTGALNTNTGTYSTATASSTRTGAYSRTGGAGTGHHCPGMK